MRRQSVRARIFFGSADTIAAPRRSTGETWEHAVASNAKRTMMDDVWLPTLETDSPQDGIELALKLSRLGMMLSRSSNRIDKESRAAKTLSDTQLIAASHVIALNFQTIAAANDWWRQTSARRDLC
jgi:hypothetical protein